MGRDIKRFRLLTSAPYWFISNLTTGPSWANFGIIESLCLVNASDSADDHPQKNYFTPSVHQSTESS